MATSARRGISLQWQMLIGFLVGLILGLIANAAAGDAAWVEFVSTYITGPVGQIFLRLIFMLVIPLLVSALIVGITEMGDIGALKRVGLKTLAFTVLVSGIAVVLALAVTNIFDPGAGVDKVQANQMLTGARQGAGAILSGQSDKPTGVAAVLAIIPSNIVTAMSTSDILAVMVFALIFGIGLLLARTPQTAVLQNAIEGIFHVSMRLMGLIIRLAPIAIACFMFNLASLFGWDLLARLGA